MQVWVADSDVFSLIEKVKTQYHCPRLEDASIAASFVDAKPFIRERFNWGKVSKFAPAAKLWHEKKHDFLITLCDAAWHILSESQKEALIDLHLNCCQVEYKPEMIGENGKQKPAKDDWGRIVYTNQVKFDEDGNPKWKVLPLDITMFQENVVRYGCWCQDLLDLKTAIEGCDERDPPLAVESF